MYKSRTSHRSEYKKGSYTSISKIFSSKSEFVVYRVVLPWPHCVLLSDSGRFAAAPFTTLGVLRGRCALRSLVCGVVALRIGVGRDQFSGLCIRRVWNRISAARIAFPWVCPGRTILGLGLSRHSHLTRPRSRRWVRPFRVCIFPASIGKALLVKVHVEIVSRESLPTFVGDE